MGETAELENDRVSLRNDDRAVVVKGVNLYMRGARLGGVVKISGVEWVPSGIVSFPCMALPRANDESAIHHI